MLLTLRCALRAVSALMFVLIIAFLGLLPLLGAAEGSGRCTGNGTA